MTGVDVSGLLGLFTTAVTGIVLLTSRSVPVVGGEETPLDFESTTAACWMQRTVYFGEGQVDHQLPCN